MGEMTAPRTIEQLEAEIERHRQWIKRQTDVLVLQGSFYRLYVLCAELAALKGDANDRTE